MIRPIVLSPAFCVRKTDAKVTTCGSVISFWHSTAAQRNGFRVPVVLWHRHSETTLFKGNAAAQTTAPKCSDLVLGALHARGGGPACRELAGRLDDPPPAGLLFSQAPEPEAPLPHVGARSRFRYRFVQTEQQELRAEA